MFHSLQTRLTIGFVTVAAATILVLGIIITTIFGEVLQTRYQEGYTNDAAAIGHFLNVGLQGDVLAFGPVINSGAVGQLIKTMSQQFQVRIRVYVNGNSAPLVDSGPLAPDPAKHLAIDNFPPLRVALNSGGYALGYVVVSDPLTDRLFIQDQVQRTAMFVVILACAAAVLIGAILAARLTAPLRLLTRATARIGGGHFAERLPEESRDEAGELAHQFNLMAQRLEESFATISEDRDRLRQFVADVSHEVRTPLTALRTFNDLLQDGAGENAATRQDFLAESARQIERLDWLTQNLLDLSRLDSGLTQIAHQRSDLAETIRRSVEANRPAASAKDVSLLCEAPHIVVDHDPPRFEQALNNIIGNAIKFSPPGGSVQVHAGTTGKHTFVAVSDHGPGIPPDEIEHIFERFYRGKEANRSGSGSGLGLAIARAIMDAHGGTISVESAPERGTTMRLTLAMAQRVPAAYDV
jgi:signal transduction histidine kinase